MRQFGQGFPMSLVVVTAGLAAAITDAAAEGKTSCSEVCVYINCINIDKLTPAVTAMS